MQQQQENESGVGNNNRPVALNPASLPFVPGTSSAASSAAAAISTNSASSSSEFDELKSPISLVHEGALKRNLTVVFEVVRETGPPHMRTFLTKCTVGDFVTEGEGNGKKVGGALVPASPQAMQFDTLGTAALPRLYTPVKLLQTISRSELFRPPVLRETARKTVFAD